MNFKTLFTIMALGLLMISCNKDEDLTVKVLGTYTGDYVEGLVTISDVETEVTKLTDTEIMVNMNVLPGIITSTFNAEMKNDTSFTIPEFKLNDSQFKGSGSLQNDTLKIILSYLNVTSDDIHFKGVK